MAKEGAIVVAVDVNPEAGAKTVADLQNYSPQSSFIHIKQFQFDRNISPN